MVKPQHLSCHTAGACWDIIKTEVWPVSRVGGRSILVFNTSLWTVRQELELYLQELSLDEWWENS